jgi:hypothetical protein
LSFVEKTKDAEDVASYLNPNLLKTIGVLDMFEIRFGNSLKILDHLQSPDNLRLYFFVLLIKKSLKIVLEEDDGSRVPSGSLNFHKNPLTIFRWDECFFTLVNKDFFIEYSLWMNKLNLVKVWEFQNYVYFLKFYLLFQWWE